MNSFEYLFGHKKDAIQKTCLLAPWVTPEIIDALKVKYYAKGSPYASGNGEHFTLIYTQIGTAFAGDCVLYLQDTACENIIIFGSCGLVQHHNGLDVGSIMCPSQSYALESFSQLLNGPADQSWPVYPADPDLLKSFRDISQDRPVPEISCATFGSIHLEQTYINYLKNQRIDAMDMECSSVFAAAQSISRRAMALLYVTDVLGEHAAFGPKSPEHRRRINEGMDAAAQLLLEFTKTI